MNNSTKSTVESMTISAELASTIAELKASISSLNALVESLKSDNEYLKHNNDLLGDEKAFLKRASQSFLKKSHTKEPRRNRKALLKSS